MRSFFKYRFFILLFFTVGLLAHQSYGQSDSLAVVEDEVSQETADTAAVRRKFLSGAEITIDYGKLLFIPAKFESKMEFGLNLRIYERFVIAGEYGMATLDPLKAYDNAIYYTVEGSYFRAGLDYYLSVDLRNFLYFGFRYGLSQFEDRGKFLIESEFWPDYEEDFGDVGLTASWYELILGSETRLQIGQPESKIHIRNLFLGWKFRFRILGQFENREEPLIYAIPGYGRTFDKTIPAVNFYIKYRLGK